MENNCIILGNKYKLYFDGEMYQIIKYIISVKQTSEQFIASFRYYGEAIEYLYKLICKQEQ